MIIELYTSDWEREREREREDQAANGLQSPRGKTVSPSLSLYLNSLFEPFFLLLFFFFFYFSTFDGKRTGTWRMDSNLAVLKIMFEKLSSLRLLSLPLSLSTRIILRLERNSKSHQEKMDQANPSFRARGLFFFSSFPSPSYSLFCSWWQVRLTFFHQFTPPPPPLVREREREREESYFFTLFFSNSFS